MKNRLLFLTVAGALAMPAVAAPAPEWNLYGTLVTEVYNAKITGSTVAANDYASRWGTNSATSNIGFKGGMQVADNVKAIFQVESQIFTGGGQDASKGQGLWANRNSGVGLTGTWGTVMLGQWDTPYKAIQVPLTQIRAGVLTDVAIIGQKGGIVLAQTTNSAYNPNYETFKRCQGNSVQYWTPNISGFEAKVLYSVEAAGANQNGDIKPTVLSLSASYDIKPANLKLFLGYEEHKDVLTTGVAANQVPGQKDTGIELAAYWIAPTNTRVTAIIEQLKYDGTGRPTSTGVVKRNAWFVSAGHPITEHHKVWGSFGQAGDNKYSDGATGLSDTGATQYALGYTYAFNKNAEVYAFIGGINNKTNGNYATMPPVPAVPSAGGDTKTYGAGIFYTF